MNLNKHDWSIYLKEVSISEVECIIDEKDLLEYDCDNFDDIRGCFMLGNILLNLSEYKINIIPSISYIKEDEYYHIDYTFYSFYDYGNNNTYKDDSSLEVGLYNLMTNNGFLTDIAKIRDLKCDIFIKNKGGK